MWKHNLLKHERIRTMLPGKFIAVNVYIKKEYISWIIFTIITLWILFQVDYLSPLHLVVFVFLPCPFVWGSFLSCLIMFNFQYLVSPWWQVYSCCGRFLVLKFAEVLVDHMCLEHMMGSVVLCYLPWSWLADMDEVPVNVGSGSWFTGLLSSWWLGEVRTGSCDSSCFQGALRTVSCDWQCQQLILLSLPLTGKF